MILDDIVSNTKDRIVADKKRIRIEKLKEKAFEIEYDENLDLYKKLKSKEHSYIFEIKKEMPGTGRIVYNFDCMTIANEYENSGADAIAVYTEPDYFKGDDEFITVAAKRTRLPIIRKDFILDEYMIYQSKVLGASAVNLISGLLDEITLNRYLNLCEKLEMDAIVECHSAMQVKRALRCKAKIISLNNRDLRDFTVDFEVTKQLIAMIDEDVVIISEGGIENYQDVEYLQKLGVNSLMIGQKIMKSLDKRHTFEQLKGLRK